MHLIYKVDMFGATIFHIDSKRDDLDQNHNPNIYAWTSVDKFHFLKQIFTRHYFGAFEV